VGLMLGDPLTGLKVGLLLELLWIGYLPVGASVPPDETLVSITATAISVCLLRSVGGDADAGLIVFVLVLLMPAAIVGQRLDFFIRKMNIKAVQLADSASDNLDIKGLEKACLSGLWRSYVLYVTAIFFLLSGGFLMASTVYPLLPENIYKGLSYASLLIPVLGLASLFSAMRLKGRYLIAGMSCVFCLVLINILGPI
jgi:PTS system mannose-specific IIC component